MFDRGHRCLGVGELLPFPEDLLERPVADLDGVHPPRDLDDGGAAEGPRELPDVDGRRGDDELEAGPPLEKQAQVPQQEIDVEAAFVGLVEDDGVVLEKVRIAADLAQQHAVGDQLDQGLGLGPVPEADLAAHLAAPGDPELLGQAPRQRQGGHPPGLGADDAGVAAPPRFEADLGQLRCFPRPGLPGDDNDLVFGDRPEDLLLARGDRQLFGVGYLRDEAEAPGAQPPRGLDALAQPAELPGQGCARATGQTVPEVPQAATDTHAVGEQTVLERRLEVADRAGVVRGRHGSDARTAVWPW